MPNMSALRKMLLPVTTVNVTLGTKKASMAVFLLRIIKPIWKLIIVIRSQFTCVSPKRKG